MHLLEMRRISCEQPFGRAASAGHAPRQQIQAAGRDGQRVGLPVLVELQAMFQVPQKLIGGGEPPIFGCGEELFIVQARERQHRSAVPHPWIGAAVETLQTLHQKFDVANAAALQLDVERARFALFLRRELFVQALARGRNASTAEKSSVVE